MTSRADKELSELLELGDRIVAMATERRRHRRRVHAALRRRALRARAPRQARARRGGRAPLGRPARDEGQAGRDDVDERSHRGRHPALRRATRSSSSSSRRRIRSPVPPIRALLVDATTAPDLDLFDPKGGERRRRAGDRDREASASSAARDFDPRISNSDGATFSRTAGGVALVLSSGFRGGVRGLVPVAQRRARRRGRGRQEAPRLPLDREALPRRARRPEDGRRGGGAAHAAQARRASRSPRARSPVVFDPDAARSILGMLAGCIMGSSIWRKSSYLVGREGTEVASDLVTIVDDPLIPRAPGLAPVRRRGPREPQERRRREGRPPHVPLRQLLARASSVAPSTGNAVARRLGGRRRAARRTSSSSPAPTRTPTS